MQNIKPIFICRITIFYILQLNEIQSVSSIYLFDVYANPLINIVRKLSGIITES